MSHCVVSVELGVWIQCWICLILVHSDLLCVQSSLSKYAHVYVPDCVQVFILLVPVFARKVGFFTVYVLACTYVILTEYKGNTANTCPNANGAAVRAGIQSGISRTTRSILHLLQVWQKYNFPLAHTFHTVQLQFP